jgi:hypothetical protein
MPDPRALVAAEVADVRPAPVKAEARHLARELALIHEPIGECAKKADLWQLTKCSIASGSDGVAELLWRRKAALGGHPPT